MSRIAQPAGERGSLKWIQRLVNDRPDLLDMDIRSRLPGHPAIEWLSPLASDDFAEYRDSSFLELLGEAALSDELSSFWPSRGPQWDALGRSASGDLILLEAKAHIAEVFSPATQAGESSRAMIDRALSEAVDAVGASPRAPWAEVFFQYANRLAHLDFLRRKHGRPAWLVFLYIVGDEEMGGPSRAAEWQAALDVVKYVLGLPKRHPLSPYVVDVFVSADEIASVDR